MISLVIAGMITTGLISMMNQFIESDKREAAFIATEKDTQIALDYITEDLREAVFVYEEITPRLRDALPNFSAIEGLGASAEPILVFWKTEPIENLHALNCTMAFGSELLQQEECRLLLIKRNTYTLVVYLQTTEASDQWLGKSRIVRYALPKYKINGEQVTFTTGFVDPAVYNNFLTWPYDKDGVNRQTQRPDPEVSDQPKPMVLADFIDIPNRTEFRSSSNQNLPPNPPTCPNNYARVPADPGTHNSFFACVRSTQGRLGANQDIIVYLRGNAEGRDRLTKTVDFIPVVQGQVTLRGVIDKFGR